MRLVSFRAEQTPEIKFPLSSVVQPLVSSQEVQGNVVSPYSTQELQPVIMPGTPVMDAFQPAQMYVEQPKKKFSFETIINIMSLGASVMFAIYLAVMLKNQSGGFFKYSFKNLFENYKNDESIIKLSKLPGMDKVKREFQLKVLNSMKYREIFEKENVTQSMMCILHGPPGTGKTNFVKSAAKEVDALVATFTLSNEGSEYLHKTSKNFRKKADAIMKYAKRNEDKQIFVLFDEVEAILTEVNGLSGDSVKAQEEEIKTFIFIMDKFLQHKNIRVFATTNKKLNPKTGDIGNMHKPAIDRFGTKIFVGNPDAEAASHALKMYLEAHPSAKEFASNPEKIKLYGRKLCGYSYRDIVHIKGCAIDLMMEKKAEAIQRGQNPDDVKFVDEFLDIAIEKFSSSKNKEVVNSKKIKRPSFNLPSFLAQIISKLKSNQQQSSHQA